MNRVVIVALRALVGVLMLGLLLIQVVILPVLAAEEAQSFPEVAFLRWPVLVLAILTVACVQVALVALWALLTLVEQGQVFSPAAFRHVDVIVAAAVVASALVAGTWWYLTLVGGIQQLGLTLMCFGLTCAGVALALLMVVMKALLRQATQLTSDLAEVI